MINLGNILREILNIGHTCSTSSSRTTSIKRAHVFLLNVTNPPRLYFANV